MNFGKVALWVLICTTGARDVSDEDFFELSWCFSGDRRDTDDPKLEENKSGGTELVFGNETNDLQLSAHHSAIMMRDSALSAQLQAIRILQPFLRQARAVIDVDIGSGNMLAMLSLHVPEVAEVWGVDSDDRLPLARRNLMGECRRCKTQRCKSLGIIPIVPVNWQLSGAHWPYSGGGSLEALESQLALGSKYDVVHVGCSLDMQTPQLDLLLRSLSNNGKDRFRVVFSYGTQDKQVMFHISLDSKGHYKAVDHCGSLMRVKLVMCENRAAPADTIVRPGPFDRTAFCDYVACAWNPMLPKVIWKRAGQILRSGSCHRTPPSTPPSSSDVENSDAEEIDEDDDDDDEPREMGVAEQVANSKLARGFTFLLICGAFLWFGVKNPPSWRRREGRTTSPVEVAELEPYVGFETDTENEQIPLT